MKVFSEKIIWIILVTAILISVYIYFTPTTNTYSIIPEPVQLNPVKGKFTINDETVIYCNFQQKEMLSLAHEFSNKIKITSGINLIVRDLKTIKDTSNVILFLHTPSYSNNEEFYRLSVSPHSIKISAPAPHGTFNALQTLYQLCPIEIYKNKLTEDLKWKISCVEIQDFPRFSYRGLHLDVSRHFFPISFIKKYIDAMAMHKLNTFHWHLTDDQGWRIQIKKYPLLTEIGSFRHSTLLGHVNENFPAIYDNNLYGGFYTQDEAREIVEYAKERYITIIPEIEMPGHAQAAIASYPWLSCRKDSTIKVATQWGVMKDVFCTRESSFEFLENVLSEIMDIFPSPYIHIGGDECPKDRWKECPDCQARMKTEKLKNENELQSYFVHRIEKFVNSRGRKIIGWDEVLEGGLMPSSTVMTWRSMDEGIAAAKNGNNVIMSPNTYCYYNYYQADQRDEPLAITSRITLETAYNFEPIPSGLSPEEQKRIIGAQANLWTEYISTPEQVEYMAFPRVTALSEALWSNKKNWYKFKKKIPIQLERYQLLGINAAKVFYDVQIESRPIDNHRLEISLNCEDSVGTIYYSLDGTNPDASSLKYTQPFPISESLSVKAIYENAKGESLGKINTRDYTVSKLTGLSYTQNVKSDWFNGAAKDALTDGVMGTTKVYSQWAAIPNGAHGDITIDLLQPTIIGKFRVGLLQLPSYCGLFPSKISLLGSKDGITYFRLGEKNIQSSNGSSWEVIRPELDFTPTKLRFLMLKLKSRGICTEERPYPREGSKIFIDEIAAW